MIILLGKTNAGKSMVQDILCKEYGFKRIVACTTRPIRTGEVDGVSYHFLSNDEFYTKIAKKKFAEYRSYNSVHGIWFYGSLKSSYRTKNGVIVLNPYGFRETRKTLTNFKNKPFSVYLDINDDTIRRRADLRGDDSAEIKRRIESDRTDFAGIESEVDLCIDANINCPEVIAQQIDDAYLKWKYE